MTDERSAKSQTKSKQNPISATNNGTNNGRKRLLRCWMERKVDDDDDDQKAEPRSAWHSNNVLHGNNVCSEIGTSIDKKFDKRKAMLCDLDEYEDSNKSCWSNLVIRECLIKFNINVHTPSCQFNTHG